MQPSPQIVQYATGNGTVTAIVQQPPQLIQHANGQTVAIAAPPQVNFAGQQQPQAAPVVIGAPTGQPTQFVQVATPQGVQLVPVNAVAQQPQHVHLQNQLQNQLVQQQLAVQQSAAGQQPAQVADATRLQLHQQQQLLAAQQQQQQMLLQQQMHNATAATAGVHMAPQIIQCGPGNGIIVNAAVPAQPQLIQNANGQIFAITPAQPAFVNYGISANGTPVPLLVNQPAGQCVQVATPQGIQLVPAASIAAQQQLMQQQATIAAQQQASQQHSQNQAHSQNTANNNLPQASDATRLHVQQIIQEQQAAILQQQLQQQHIQQQQQAMAKKEASHHTQIRHLLPANAIPQHTSVVQETQTSLPNSDSEDSKSEYSNHSASTVSNRSVNQTVSSTTSSINKAIAPKPPSNTPSHTTTHVQTMRVASDGQTASTSTSMTPPLTTSPGIDQEPESTTHHGSLSMLASEWLFVLEWLDHCFVRFSESSIAETINNTDAAIVDGVNLSDIRDFAKQFKLRRLQLGLTQTQVGMALSATQGPSYSQSAICRFEKLDITPKSAQKIKPVLEAWMSEAETKLQNGNPAALSEFMGSESNKKRKRRTSFTPQALDLLNEFFKKNTHPSSLEMTELAERLNYEREVVRVWFCNKRQALRNTVRRYEDGPNSAM